MSRTPEERLAELLADFRTHEPVSAPWLEDEPVKRVLRAWTSLPTKLSAPLTIGGVPMHGHNRWKYAWKFRALDLESVAAATGLAAPEAGVIVDRLAAARFIYPDGTLSAAAESAART